jgi:cytoskeletal protein CcmA (bactofilin family)
MSMFSSKKTTNLATPEIIESVEVKPPVPVSNNAINSIVRGTKIEGSVTAENDIRVDGVIKGSLTCSAKVIIGQSGLIDGEVKCQNAVIEGKFYGILKVTDLLSVKETAEIVGDVTTAKLSVTPGAIFDVTCTMKAEKKATPKPEPKPVKEETVQANGNANGGNKK